MASSEVLCMDCTLVALVLWNVSFAFSPQLLWFDTLPVYAIVWPEKGEKEVRVPSFSRLLTLSVVRTLFSSFSFFVSSLPLSFPFFRAPS